MDKYINLLKLSPKVFLLKNNFKKTTRTCVEFLQNSVKNYFKNFIDCS